MAPTRRSRWSIASNALTAGWHDDAGTLVLLQQRTVTDPEESIRELAMHALVAARASTLGAAPEVSAGDDGMPESG
ncbi:MAG: hypothetical protein ACRDSP_20720 [Pseudonocardiaceae bacterium]